MASGKGYQSQSEGKKEENCSFDLGNASALSESVGLLAPTRVTLGRPVGGVFHDGFATYPAVCLLWLAAFLVPAVIVTSIRCSSREDLLHRRKSLSPSLPRSPTSKMIHNKGWNRVAVSACRGILWHCYNMLGACFHV